MRSPLLWVGGPFSPVPGADFWTQAFPLSSGDRDTRPRTHLSAVVKNPGLTCEPLFHRPPPVNQSPLSNMTGKFPRNLARLVHLSGWISHRRRHNSSRTGTQAPSFRHTSCYIWGYYSFLNHTMKNKHEIGLTGGAFVGDTIVAVIWLWSFFLTHDLFYYF